MLAATHFARLNSRMLTTQPSRPATMPSTCDIDVSWHGPVNDHPWLTHADVIAAQAAMYSRDSAVHALLLAAEAASVGATRLADGLMVYASTASRSVADA